MKTPLTFTAFTDKIVSEIKNYLPADYAASEIILQKCPKPGNQILTGIVMRKPGSKAAPMLYLDELYSSYTSGEIDFPDIFEEIKDIICQDCSCIPTDTGQVLNWDSARDYIISRFINISNGLNEAYLVNRPYTLMDNSNFAVIYDVDFSTPEQMMTSPITYDLMHGWNVSLQEIDHAARVNNPRLRPVCIDAIGGLLSAMLPNADLLTDVPLMYVVTNEQCSLGAITVTYDGVDKQLQDLLGDYYLIPSSVHEMIVVSRSNFDAATLSEMIHDINRTEVQPCDILDDIPYIIKYGQLIIAPITENANPKDVPETIPDCPVIPVLS